MMYLFTAIGLTPGGSSTHKQYTEQHNQTGNTNIIYIKIIIHKYNNKNTLFTQLNKSIQNIQPYVK
jgi:hypothetical protein